MTLPPGWVEAKITELAEPVKQRIPDADEVIDYIDIGSIDRETKRINACQKIIGNKAPSRARKVVRPGDVLVSMTRPNLNAVALVPDGFENPIASTGFEVLRSEIIDPRWFFAQVRGGRFVNEMSDLVQGALYPAIRSSDVQAYSLALPPLDEQKRIADKLDQTLAIVERAKARLARVPEILKQFRQSVLAAATDGRLTEDWRSDARKIQFDVANESIELPHQWRFPKFGEVYQLIDGDRGPNYPKQSDYKSSGYCLFLSTKNVRPFGFLFDETVFLSEAKHSSMRNGTLKRGDVVITTRGTLGNVAVYDESVPYDPVRINSGMLIIRAKESRLNSRYLKLFIAAPLFSNQLTQRQSGSAQPQIPAGILKDFNIPVPPESEQLEIVRRVETLFTLADRIEARYQAISGQVDKLTQSLLAKAFRGELVPQDPNDEPASVLLDRIRAYRASEPTSKRGRRKGTHQPA